MKTFNFAENLRNIRVSKWISQDAMALNLGITQTKYSKIERGSLTPSYQLVCKMAKVLKVSIEELYPIAHAKNIEDKRSTEKTFFHQPIVMIIIFAASVVLVTSVHALAQEICIAFEASANINLTVRMGAAFATIVYIVRLVIRGRKSETLSAPSNLHQQ